MTGVLVTVNGVPTDVASGCTVADLVTARAGEHRRVAVARNGEVVPRSTWADTRLVAGDDVEILVPVAGG